MGFGPQLVDLDGDGRNDIISGSWPGALYFFARNVDGTFAAAKTIKGRDGKEIDVGSASAVFAADWDGDGDLDLVVGNLDGNVYLVRNQGKGAFGKQELLTCGERGRTPVKPAGDAGPCVADWDGDGKPDLLVGCDDGVVFYRNLGTRQKPKLASPEWLVRKGKVGTRNKICVLDWNRDGRLDLLVGDFSYKGSDYHGWVWLLLRKPAAKTQH